LSALLNWFCSLVWVIIAAGCATGIDSSRLEAALPQPQPAGAQALSTSASPTQNRPVQSPNAVDSPATSPSSTSEQVRVYFAHGSDIEPSEAAKIREQARRLIAKESVRVMLTGYMPARGSRSYEMAIAEKRVQTVALMLRDSGVPKKQILINGHHRHVPACDKTCSSELPFVGFTFYGQERTTNETAPKTKFNKMGSGSPVRAK
jgi:outer membrane protein OmpA-like peptidoglycan-associated protein